MSPTYAQAPVNSGVSRQPQDELRTPYLMNAWDFGPQTLHATSWDHRASVVLILKPQIAKHGVAEKAEIFSGNCGSDPLALAKM